MEMPFLKLFYWSGVIFWGLTAVFFLVGMVSSWRAYREEKRAREAHRMNRIGGNIVAFTCTDGFFSKDFEEDISKLKEVEKALFEVQESVKKKGRMSLFLESKFGGILDVIGHIRRTFESMEKDKKDENDDQKGYGLAGNKWSEKED